LVVTQGDSSAQARNPRDCQQANAGTLELDPHGVRIAFTRDVVAGSWRNAECAISISAPLAGWRLQLQVHPAKCFQQAKLSNTTEVVF